VKITFNFFNSERVAMFVNASAVPKSGMVILYFFRKNFKANTKGVTRGFAALLKIFYCVFVFNMQCFSNNNKDEFLSVHQFG
jgi:ribosomal protein L6P/L9E